MPKAKEMFTTLDVFLSGFLLLRGIQPLLQSKEGRITFYFAVNDDLFRLIRDFNGNALVPVAQYATAVKALRGQMLSMRNQT